MRRNIDNFNFIRLSPAAGATPGPAGFTLVELAIVLVIVGLLVGMSAGMLSPLTKRVKRQETRDTVSEVYSAIVGYAEANKTLPAALTALGGKLIDAYGQNLIYYPG